MDFAVHQLGHTISGKYDTPHGESLSIAWPAWARYVYKDNIARFAKYARRVWNIESTDDETASLQGIKATEDYFKLIDMPVTLTESVGENCKNDIDELADFCTYHKTRTIGSFRVLDYNAIRDVFKMMV